MVKRKPYTLLEVALQLLGLNESALQASLQLLNIPTPSIESTYNANFYIIYDSPGDYSCKQNWPSLTFELVREIVKINLWYELQSHHSSEKWTITKQFSIWLILLSGINPLKIIHRHWFANLPNTLLNIWQELHTWERLQDRTDGYLYVPHIALHGDNKYKFQCHHRIQKLVAR